MEPFVESQDNFEKLFLFEFLVDHLVIYTSRLNLDKKTVGLLGPCAVRFQFLNYPPIEVNEDSFTPSTKPLFEEKKINLKSGKSCMFSLSALKSKKLLEQSSFDVYITVYRYKLQKYTPGHELEKPEDVFIGRTKVNLGSVFKDMYNSPKQTTERISQTKSSASKLVDNDGTEVGRIIFLIRISCFGFMVMTGFQLPEEEQKDFKYKNIVYDKTDEPEEVVQPSAEASEPCKPCSDVPKKKEKGKGDHKRKSKRPSEDKPKPKEPEPSKDQRPTCPYGYPPCGCPCRAPQVQRPCPGEMFPPQLLQGYDMQDPYNLQAQYMNNTQQFGPNRAKDMDIDPGSVGIRGNQLVFKMPNQQVPPQAPVEGKFASSVYYKMEDEKQNGARNVIQILPKNPNEAVDPSKVDEKQDVMILKLGKKRMLAGKKPKLELELRTPKMKEEKPGTDVKDTQYLESDIPKPKSAKSGAKSGAKSAKGKGKKKK